MACIASNNPCRSPEGTAAATIVAAALLLLAAAAHADTPPAPAPIGVLPVVGVKRSAASSLAERLARALAERTRRAFVGPRALGEQIAKRGQTQQAMAQVEAQITAAEEATLRMDRPAAIAAAEAALNAAIEGFADLHAPRALVRAHVARALALLLEPSDPEAARAAFSAALTLDPSYQPGGGGLAPRAEGLLQQARKARRRSRQPTLEPDVLASVMDRAEVDQIVQVTIKSSDGGSTAIVERLAGGSQRSKHRQDFAVAPEALDADQLAPVVVQALELQPLAAAAPPPKKRRARPDDRRHSTTPWYRRWWVWTAAGAVLAGAGVTLAVALSGDNGGGGGSRPDGRQPVTLRVEFK